MVVGVAGGLNGVVDQFLECLALANELNQFGDAATSAEHNKFLLFLEKLFDCAAFFLVQKLVDLHVSSVIANKSLDGLVSDKSERGRILSNFWIKC